MNLSVSECGPRAKASLILPDSILKAVGQGAYASCSAQVDDPELVMDMSQTDPNGNRIINSLENLVSTSEDGTTAKLDLIITNLRERDVGENCCSAIHVGNQNLEAKVMVESFMEIDSGDTPAHQTLLVGQEGKIKCTPRAMPAAHVDWFKNMEQLKNGLHKDESGEVH